MQVQAVAELKRRGCLTIVFYIILLIIPFLGWIALFMLLRGQKSRTVAYAICQNCGLKQKV